MVGGGARGGLRVEVGCAPLVAVYVTGFALRSYGVPRPGLMYRLGAIAVCERVVPLNPDDIRRLIEIAGMDSTPRWVHGHMYALYLPRIEEVPEAVVSDLRPVSLAASLRW